MTISLHRLLEGIVEAPMIAIGGLNLDSRAIVAGDAFVALQGGSQHGLAHAAQAIERGAVVILSDRAADAAMSVPVLVVPALRAQLGRIAARFHGTSGGALRLIGITGTNGKTSSVQLIADALNRSGHCAGTIGTLGIGLHGDLVAGERTTPDVLSMHAAIADLQRRGADHVVMEVSSHALDQGRVDGLDFDIAGFTNLTRDHLDYHGDMDTYGAAKARLFDRPGLRAAVINHDDPFGAGLLDSACAAQRIGYSALGAAGAGLRAEHIVADARGLRFELVHGTQRAVIQSALLGRFNVANLLLVAGVLLTLAYDFADIAAHLQTLQPVHGRMNRLGGDGDAPLVVVDYAHTPDALEKALDTLRAHTAGRLICVFGCGGDRDRGKRPLMGAIAEQRADLMLITDDNPRSEDGARIVADIHAGLRQPARARIERDRRLAIAAGIAAADIIDTVLIAGKGHEPYQEIKGVKHHFDDLEEARTALAAYSARGQHAAAAARPGVQRA